MYIIYVERITRKVNVMLCTGCGMFGSHKPEKCWKLHPELKPKNMAGGEERDKGRYRDQERGLEAEKKEGKEAREEGKKALIQKLEE